MPDITAETVVDLVRSAHVSRAEAIQLVEMFGSICAAQEGVRATREAFDRIDERLARAYADRQRNQDVFSMLCGVPETGA